MAWGLKFIDTNLTVVLVRLYPFSQLAGAVLDITKARHAGQGGQPVLTRFFYSNQDMDAFPVNFQLRYNLLGNGQASQPPIVRSGNDPSSWL